MTDFPKPDRSMRLLIVDDEQNIRSAIARALTLKGYQAEEASNGRSALQLLQQSCYDLMLLDMRMPEMDGVEVMHRARQIQPDLPIIVLTGHATLESAIAAVKSDAIDYLLKPASLHDIVATVSNALQSRAEQVQHQHLLRVMSDAMAALTHTATPDTPTPASIEPTADRFRQAGTLTLDRQKRLVIISGEWPRTIELTEGEATVFDHLLSQPDVVQSCRHLVYAAWGYEQAEPEAQSLIRPYIFRLRQKIETDPNQPHFIRTVRGRGYVFTVNS